MQKKTYPMIMQGQDSKNRIFKNGEGKSDICRMRGNQLPGGSIVPRYILQLLFFVKNHKIAKNSTTTQAREKISTDLESL
jgi:hypothetical protein